MATQRGEARLTIGALGAVLIAVAALGLWREIVGLPEDGGGYLGGLWARSLIRPYTFALLAGVLAVPLHALWVAARFGASPAYGDFALWAQTLFTALGFLGTIVGISLAVAGLAPAMAEGDPGGLIDGLSTAFDTTFLGLTAAIMLMILRKIFALRAAP